MGSPSSFEVPIQLIKSVTIVTWHYNYWMMRYTFTTGSSILWCRVNGSTLLEDMTFYVQISYIYSTTLAICCELSSRYTDTLRIDLHCELLLNWYLNNYHTYGSTFADAFTQESKKSIVLTILTLPIHCWYIYIPFVHWYCPHILQSRNLWVFVDWYETCCYHGNNSQIDISCE